MGTGSAILFTIFPVIIIGIFVVAAVHGISQWHRNNNSPVEQYAVSVAAKRAHVSHHHHDNHAAASTSYYVTFTFADGGRREFCVDGRQYGQIAERDEGMLRFQGTRFLEFRRH